MLKVLELFSGVGCQTQALKNIGIEHQSTQCEIDKYAESIYNQIHGNTENLGDITKVDENTLSEGQWDLITYSFPCFTGDTLVLTRNGYKQIKDIQVGDNVITHTGTFKQVVNVFNNGLKDIVKIKGMGVDEIKCTPNHKFYVREKKYRWEHKGRVSKEGWKKKDKIRYFDEPKWVEAKDLTKNHFFGIPINTNEIIPEWNGIDLEWSDGRKTRHKNELSKYMNNNDFWWLIGRYLGDGWCRTNGGIIICTAHNEVEEVTQVLDRLGLHYNNAIERTITKIHIPIKEIGLFCSQFGKGALNKHLPGMIFDLPRDLLKSFIDGYLSADGSCLHSKHGRIYKASSISRELIYGISMCIMKVYNNPISLYKENRPSQCIIEGRIVNQHSGYQIRFNEYKSSSDNAFYEGGYLWVPFKCREDFGKDIVYDIEVDTDHSFTANNVIVHNCTNISVAGQQEGLEKNSGTASSLLWECERIIRKVKPTYLLMENVKNLLSKKHIHNFEDWLKILEDMGYKNYYKVLNAKDFGVPQNRERVFCVSILGEHEPYEFPNGFPLTLRLKDMLEDNVEAKYYLSEKIQQRFKVKPQGDSIIGTTAPEFRTIGQRDIVYNTNGTMGALVATDYKQPKQVIEFNMPNGKKAEFDENVSEPNCFKEVRTEEGKLARKIARQQGLGDTTPRDKDSKMFITKNDGVANCLTTTCGVEQIIVEPEIKRLFNIYGEDKGSGYAGNVYDQDGLSPTIVSSTGGNKQPLIYSKCHLEVEEQVEPIVCQPKTLDIKKGTIAFIPNGAHGYAKYVFEKDITITLEEQVEPEPLIVASRGRYTDKNNPTKTEQCLEINDSGLTNTITTVQKDNYVAEPKIIVHNVVQPVSVRKFEVDIESLKTLLRTSKWESGLTNNQIADTLGVPLTKVEHWFRTDNCFAIPDAEIWYKLKELLKITTTDFDESITTFEEKDGVYEKANRCYDENGLSPTLTASAACEKIVCHEKVEDTELVLKSKCKRLENLVKKTDFEEGKVLNMDLYNQTTNENVSQCLTEPHHNTQRIFDGYRIRKLTPRECYRLMGWKDAEFDRISGISDVQLYKTAGNGIVIPVLEAIFEKMFK